MHPGKVSLLAPLLVAGSLAGWATPAIAAAEAAAAAPGGSVLVLYSNGRLLPANVEFDQGLRAALPRSPEPELEIFDEFLDVPRFATPEHLLTMESYLKDKYARRPPTVLVSAGEEALGFLLDHRGDLFPEVPLVYAAVARSALKEHDPLPSDVVGVPLEFDFAGTVTQALRWHPRVRHLWIVTGASEWDRRNEARLRRESRQFADRLTVGFLSALPMAELTQRLGALEADSIVFAPGFFQDGAGRNFIPRESIAAVAAAAPAPVYGAYLTILGTGAVGGSVSSFADAGREAGRETALLLAGSPPDSLDLPREVPSSMHVDWRQIRRWKIDPNAIPPDTVVHFREPTLFEAHPDQVLLAASVLALQAGLIALLLVERRRRHAAEAAEQVRRLELAHASRLAVAGELMGSIAHEINQPLGAILANADAADLILAAGGDRRQELAEILADIRRDDLRASEVIQRMRDLLGQHKLERKALDLNDIVSEIETIMRAEARRRGVALQFQRAPEPMPVMGDRIQLQQVLINLVLNAMDAVAEQTDARRTVDVSVARRARVAVLTVRDRGHGVAPEHRARLFDSLFSTKPNGMGLGLSITRTIVEAHGGRVRAESGPGEGAVFEAELPLAIAADAAAPDPA